MKINNFFKNNYSIKNLILLLFLISVSSNTIFAQQVTGLSEWNIYLDPGHSQYENMGIYGYSEAEKNLRVGLNLKQMLLDWTDIDTVYICRDNDQQYVGLTQRTDQANALGAAHYHSIHGNAGGSTYNYTLLLWGQMGIDGPEKIPQGGKKMSDLMVPLLTAGMRTTTIGSRGDRTFYGGDYSYPYLAVNRQTNMASELSEAGFHTNPTQNQLNMNAKWKRLEAKTMFWTILKYHNIPRPYAGTVVGVIKDIESGLAVNGAIATLDGQSDTTDTWASLFYKYSSDSTLLRNGFYYFEDIPAGTYPLQVTAPGFENYSTNVTPLDTFFTFQDINLVSTKPPTVISTDPIENDSLYPGIKNITINFSRPINRDSIDIKIIITPILSTFFTWSNGDKTITINTTNFEFDTVYQITVKGNVEDKYGHLFDGDGDGVGGDDYIFNIRTKVADLIPPSVVDIYPENNATNVEIKPIINVSFNELLNTSTIGSRYMIVQNSTQAIITKYILKYYPINGRSVLNFFITTPLAENETYTIKILAGIEDAFGNPTTSDFNYEFTTGNSDYLSQTIIDNFESGINNWLQPENSGSTVGIFPLTTNLLSSTAVWNLNTGGRYSMQLDYDWDTTKTNFLIREYYSPVTPSFDKNGLLQVFIFGDGNYNMFRFCLREINGIAPTNLEVSLWYDINWIGWKLVSWDLDEGQTGNWLGNGILEPPFIFDSFQFTYQPGNASQGTYYLDDVRTATFSPTDVKQEDNQIPIKFVLEQNYPNPFNPSTQIKFSIAKSSNVKLIISDILGREVANLVNDNLAVGNYSIIFDAKNISSGVYFYTLITDNFKQSRKMILMK
jgi:N-acetylmuramoyl-L-alanine amidase